MNSELLKKAIPGLSASEADALTAVCGSRECPAGTRVFSEGDQATSLYVVDRGSVEILKEGSDGTSLVVAVLGTGALFGEMAFVDRSPRAASAEAKGALHVLEIRYDELDSLLSREPSLGLKLYRSLAEALCVRIRHTTRDFSSIFLS